MYPVTFDISFVDSFSYHIQVSCSDTTGLPSSTTHTSQQGQLSLENIHIDKNHADMLTNIL